MGKYGEVGKRMEKLGPARPLTWRCPSAGCWMQPTTKVLLLVTTYYYSFTTLYYFLLLCYYLLLLVYEFLQKVREDSRRLQRVEEG